jgi:Tfp pilus assembly major pilin PilA
VAWELRWVIAAAAVMAAAAVPIARHVERDRQRIAELAAETTRADRAEQRLATLQHATGVLAVTVASQDTPAPWIPAQRDGRSR